MMDWNAVKKRCASELGAQHLLTVEHVGGSDARARYYTLEDGRWRLLARCTAFIGRNGMGKEREGDGKTPAGEFGVLGAFGIKSDPGTALPYLEVRKGTVAVDEEGPGYNRIVQCGPESPLPGGERMWELSPEYDYALQTDFNRECIWPLGSAIFVHCKGNKAWTGGCVALDERVVKLMLLTADARLVISIH